MVNENSDQTTAVGTTGSVAAVEATAVPEMVEAAGKPEEKPNRAQIRPEQGKTLIHSEQGKAGRKRGKARGEKRLVCGVPGCGNSQVKKGVVREIGEGKVEIFPLCERHETPAATALELVFAEARRIRAEQEALQTKEQLRKLREEKKRLESELVRAKEERMARPAKPRKEQGRPAVKAATPPAGEPTISDEERQALNELLAGPIVSKAEGSCSIGRCGGLLGGGYFVGDTATPDPKPLCQPHYAGAVAGIRLRAYWSGRRRAGDSSAEEKLSELGTWAVFRTVERMRQVLARRQAAASGRSESGRKMTEEERRYSEGLGHFGRTVFRGAAILTVLARLEKGGDLPLFNLGKDPRGCQSCSTTVLGGFTLEKGLIRPVCQCVADAREYVLYQKEKSEHALKTLGSKSTAAAYFTQKIEHWEEVCRNIRVFNDARGAENFARRYGILLAGQKAVERPATSKEAPSSKPPAERPPSTPPRPKTVTVCRNSERREQASEFVALVIAPMIQDFDQKALDPASPKDLPKLADKVSEVATMLDEEERSWLYQAWAILLDPNEIVTEEVEVKSNGNGDREAKAKRRAARETIISSLSPHLSDFSRVELEKSLQDLATISEVAFQAADETVKEALKKVEGEERAKVEEAYQLLSDHRLATRQRQEETAAKPKEMRLSESDLQHRKLSGDLVPVHVPTPKKKGEGEKKDKKGKPNRNRGG